jgi:hypothetical protein
MGMCKKCAHKHKAIGGLDGSFDNLPLELISGTAAGSVVASVVDKYALDKVSFFASNPAIKSAAKIALGVFLVGQESDIVKGLGLGMVAKSATQLVGQFAPQLGIAGMQELGVQQQYIASPYQDLGVLQQYIAAPNTISEDLGVQQQYVAQDPIMVDPNLKIVIE